MATNDFNPEVDNAAIQQAQSYLAPDGSLKFISPFLSSSNFDGSIPKIDNTAFPASAVSTGMLLSPTGGGVSGLYYPVVEVSYEDPDLNDDIPPDTYTITYLDGSNESVEVVYQNTDLVAVRYEDWENKYLGTQGWTITSGGNAIFSNVGVRGDLEATTLDVGGDAGITFDGNTVTIGASVIVNAPITFNGVTPEQLSSSLSGYIPDGQAALDIVSNSTTITGGNISTGKIKSTGYNGPGTGSAFSSAGMMINLDDGSIASKNFRITTSGSAFFKGSITATTGYFGSDTVNWKIGGYQNSGSYTTSIETDTLKLYTQNISGSPHGNISFFEASGLSAGSISNALSNTDKIIRGLGNGLHVGTVDDYYFVPGAGNAAKSRIKSQGLEIYDGSDRLTVKFNNDGLNIASSASLNFLNSSGVKGADIHYNTSNDQLIIDNGGSGGGVVNIRASQLQLNGVSVGTGGGGSYTLTNEDIIALPSIPSGPDGVDVLYGAILGTVPGSAAGYPDNSIVIIT